MWADVEGNGVSVCTPCSRDRRLIESRLSKHIRMRMRVHWNRFYNSVTPPKSWDLKGPHWTSLLHFHSISYSIFSFSPLFLHHESEEQEDQFELFCKEQWEAWRLWRL